MFPKVFCRGGLFSRSFGFWQLQWHVAVLFMRIGSQFALGHFQGLDQFETGLAGKDDFVYISFLGSLIRIGEIRGIFFELFRFPVVVRVAVENVDRSMTAISAIG